MPFANIIFSGFHSFDLGFLTKNIFDLFCGLCDFQYDITKSKKDK